MDAYLAVREFTDDFCSLSASFNCSRRIDEFLQDIQKPHAVIIRSFSHPKSRFGST